MDSNVGTLRVVRPLRVSNVHWAGTPPGFGAATARAVRRGTLAGIDVAGVEGQRIDIGEDRP
jgi:hypothetical protein